ncbi:MAG: glycosyltransferase family 1 protein [Betaproteobacteria bacterium]
MKHALPTQGAQLHIEQLDAAPAPMRIAVVTETYPPEVNGVAITLAKMIDGLRARHHGLHLIRPTQPVFDQQRPADPDELLTTGMPIPCYPGLRLGLPAKRLLVRHWSTQRPDVVHIATEGPLGWSALHAARQLKLPISTDFRTNFHAYSSHYGAGWLQRTILGYLRKFHNRASCTTVPTQALAEELSSWGFERLTVISRGVDTQRFSPAHRSEPLRQQWGAGADEPVALYVGRLAPEKNLGLVIRAFEAMKKLRPETRLVIVGDGPQRQALMQQCPAAHFAGVRSGLDLAAHYASADLFIFPSLSETFGNVTLEAMASGVPALAYKHAAAVALLGAGRGGVAVQVGQEQAFIAQAEQLALDLGRCRQLGQEARQVALGLAWDGIVSQFEALLRATIAHHSIKPLTPSVSRSALSAPALPQ